MTVAGQSPEDVYTKIESKETDKSRKAVLKAEWHSVVYTLYKTGGLWVGTLQGRQLKQNGKKARRLQENT